MSFADNLYYLRKKEGISQEELAERLGVSRQAVSKWETGDTYPETEKIIALCDMFSVTMDSLMRGDVTEQTAADMPGQTQVSGEPEENRDSTSGESEGKNALASEEKHLPDKNEEKDEDGLDAKERAMRSVFKFAVCAFAAIAYIICGTVWGLWRTAWVIFVFTPIITSFIEVAFAAQGKKFLNVLDFTENIAIFGTLSPYLLYGLVTGKWNSLWPIFFLIPITFIVCGIVEHVICRINENKN